MNATPLLMDSTDLARVPALPGEMTEEMTMNIIPSYLRMSHLQNIIDQAPKAHTADRARELMQRLPRVPVDGHEMYSAGAGEVDQAYVGTVRREVSGRWSWHISMPGGRVVDAVFGFLDEPSAQESMDARLYELNVEACV